MIPPDKLRALLADHPPQTYMNKDQEKIRDVWDAAREMLEGLVISKADAKVIRALFSVAWDEGMDEDGSEELVARINEKWPEPWDETVRVDPDPIRCAAIKARSVRAPDRDVPGGITCWREGNVEHYFLHDAYWHSIPYLPARDQQ